MNNRVYFLDALRTFVIALVVVYHVTLLYTKQFQFVQNPVPQASNQLFMLLTFLINGPMLNSIMFFIAGYFALEAYQRKGGRAFIKDKLKKLGIPYFGGLVTLAPLTQYIANRSWGSNTGLGQFWLKEFFQPQTINPHHLWFIGILLLFFLIATPLFARLQNREYQVIQQKRDVQNRVLVLFLLITFTIYYSLSFFYEAHVFISFYLFKFSPVMLPIYAAYFGLGVYASRQMWFTEKGTERIYPWGIAYVGCIILYVGTAILADISPIDQVGKFIRVENHPLMAFAVNGIIFTGMMLLIALFKKYTNKASAVMAWLSKNSYGAYLVHFLIVYVVVYLMCDTPLPLMAKYIFQALLCLSLTWTVAAFLKGHTPLRTWL